MKKFLMAAAALMLMMTMTMLTSCADSDGDDSENPTLNPTDGSSLVGSWFVDITGSTFPLWNYGSALHMMTFGADGTGSFDTFYTLNEKPIARDNQTFTYTTTPDGHLTMKMEDGDFDYTYQFSNGQLILSYDDNAKTYVKASADMVAKFADWGQQKLPKVPNPARYTVFVYGNAGGKMDYIIEDGFWEQMKPLLTDSTNVRVVCFYKYGKDMPEEGNPFTGKYSDPGDIVWFELNSKTDLEKLREEGLANLGFEEEAKKLKLCDPASIRMFMELSSLVCPAQEYVFAIWGHGNGFEPYIDVPGKYDEKATLTRGVIGDEWNNKEKLDMYELADAIRSTGVGRLNTLFFHNCLMGNIETLTEVRDIADYICCSAHILSSDGIVLSEFVKGLIEQENTEDAVKQMFEKMRPNWDNQYPNDIEEGDNLPNGDFKMLRTSEFDGLLNACRELATRLVEIYPTQREAIARATKSVYRFCHIDESVQVNSIIAPFFDLADFAHKLAVETGDEKMAAISAEIDDAFDHLIIHYADVNWNEQHLDHYTLSVSLYHQYFYSYDFVGAGQAWLSNISEGYEQCAFHKLTGWGNWLRINEILPFGNPASQGGGPLNK